MTIRYAAYACGLAVAWVMLWDRVSIANVLGGLLVAGVLLVVFPLRPVGEAERRRVRPLPLLRLAASVLGDLVVSNVLVARTIISRHHRLRTGVVACPMRSDSPKVLSTVANIIALSPGMMAVDATAGPPTLYVHVLLLNRQTDVRRRVARLEALVIDAVGSGADRHARSLETGRGR
jgi:multicomponent Na+:H+ antiporter subunit E